VCVRGTALWLNFLEFLATVGEKLELRMHQTKSPTLRENREGWGTVYNCVEIATGTPGFIT
jgi:hypothetical protein